MLLGHDGGATEHLGRTIAPRMEERHQHDGRREHGEERQKRPQEPDAHRGRLGIAANDHEPEQTLSRRPTEDGVAHQARHPAAPESEHRGERRCDVRTEERMIEETLRVSAEDHPADGERRRRVDGEGQHAAAQRSPHRPRGKGGRAEACLQVGIAAEHHRGHHEGKRDRAEDRQVNPTARGEAGRHEGDRVRRRVRRRPDRARHAALRLVKLEKHRV